MSRRWLVYLPLALTVAGAVAVPVTASAAGHDTPPAPACTKDTQQVQDLVTAVTNLGTDVSAATPDPKKLSQDAGSLFAAITGAQAAGCLPALPTNPPAATPPPAPHAATNCTGDTIDLLTAALSQIKAATAATPDPTAMAKAVTDIATAIGEINTDSCLPVNLTAPTVPTPPSPPPAPPAN